MSYTNWQQRIINLEKEVDGIVIPEVPTLLKSTKFFPGTKEDFESQDEATIQEFLKDVDADGVVIFQEIEDILPGKLDGTNIVVTTNGNMLYRHKDNDGSVLVCNIHDKQIYLKVYDAKFRGLSKWSSSNIASGVLPFLTTGDDHNSAKYNTDQLMTLSTALAAQFCRNHGADLPTVNETFEIWKNRTEIDSIDQTVDSYPLNSLSNWGFGATNGQYCWSSSERNNTTAYAVSNVGGSNAIYNFNKNIVNGVIPVLELNI